MERHDHLSTKLSPERSASSGDALTMDMNGRLVLEMREAVLKRLKRRFSHIPPEASLAEELIAERRAEARREEAARLNGEVTASGVSQASTGRVDGEPADLTALRERIAVNSPS